MAETVDWEKLVVRVFLKEGDKEHFQGTAFLLNDEYLLTARHVVKKGQAAFAGNRDAIVLRNGPWTGARYLREAPIPHGDDRIDIALLRLRQPNDKPLNYWRLADGKNLVNSKVNIAGFEDAELDAKAPEFQVLNDHNQFQTYDLQGKVQHGLSGGPVFIGDRLVGILYARTDAPEPQKDQNKTFIYPYSAFREFLIAQGVVPTIAPIQDSRGKKYLSPEQRAAWIDRQDQWELQIIKRLESDARKKTFAFVIAGVYQEWPDAFKHRFREQLEGVDSTPIKLNFYYRDAKQWESALWKCLLDTFPCLEVRKNPEPERLKALLCDELANSPSPLLFYCKLDEHVSARPPFIEKLVHLWESLELNGGKQHCMVFVHDFVPADWLGYGAFQVERWREAIASRLAANGLPHVTVSLLRSPSRKDVNSWSGTMLEESGERSEFDKIFARVKGVRIPHLTIKETYEKIANTK